MRAEADALPGPGATDLRNLLPARTPATAQAQLRAPLYEDKVESTLRLFDLATIEDKSVTKDELMQDDDLPEGYGG